jgi:pimeloyl-ACP methyl ester carboxylesterase
MADASLLSPVGVANTYLGTMPNTNILDLAHNNPRPALMCWGEKERRFAPLAQWAVDNMANLEVVKLNTGHGVNMEDSAAFDHAVVEFLQTHQKA